MLKLIELFMSVPRKVMINAERVGGKFLLHRSREPGLAYFGPRKYIQNVY